MYLLPFQIKVALPALRFLANALPKDSLVTGPVAGRFVGLPRLLGPCCFLGALGEVRVEGLLFSIGFRSSLVISGALGRTESLTIAGLLVLGGGGILGRSRTMFLGISGAFLRPRPPVLLEPVEGVAGLAGALVFGFGLAGAVVCGLGLAGDVLLGALGLAGAVVLGRAAGGCGRV